MSPSNCSTWQLTALLFEVTTTVDGNSVPNMCRFFLSVDEALEEVAWISLVADSFSHFNHERDNLIAKCLPPSPPIFFFLHVILSQ